MLFLGKNLTKEQLGEVSKLDKKERQRLDAILAMHTLVCYMNDEDAYMSWIYLVPDGAGLTDFLDFSYSDEKGENEDFDAAVRLFKALWNQYLDGGLYIAEKTY